MQQIPILSEMATRINAPFSPKSRVTRPLKIHSGAAEERVAWEKYVNLALEAVQGSGFGIAGSERDISVYFDVILKRG